MLGSRSLPTSTRESHRNFRSKQPPRWIALSPAPRDRLRGGANRGVSAGTPVAPMSESGGVHEEVATSDFRRRTRQSQISEPVQLKHPAMDLLRQVSQVT